MKKYELTDETKTLADGTVLHRIRAARDFTLTDGAPVCKGDLGGWIERDGNLSHEGNTWVCGNAQVYGDAQVYGNAWVCGSARVCGSAWVYGNAEVCGNAQVESSQDYAVHKNTWSSFRWFTYTRSNRMWRVGCFCGTGEELIAKAYKDSELCGRCYEAIVRAQEAIEKAKEGGEV